MSDLDDTRDAAWSRQLFDSLNDGGVWGVPRSGLVFAKRGDVLALTEVMPWEEGMPVTRDELIAYQQSEFALIQERFKLAGITVEDASEYDGGRYGLGTPGGDEPPQVGKMLDDLSIEELEARRDRLRSEVERLTRELRALEETS